MVQMLRDIGVWLGTGPLAPVSMVLGILFTVAALAIVILELTGRTLSGRRIVRSNFRWDRTAILVLLVTATFVVAIYPLRFNFIHLLPKGPRVVPSLAPVLAVVFGLPGVFGYMLGLLITMLLSGLTVQALITALWAALSFVWVTWLPYKAVPEPSFSGVKATLNTIGRFYLWAVIVGPLLHLWVSPVRQVLMGGDPTAVWGRMVPMIMINHDLPYLVVAPIVLIVLYPVAKVLQLYWRDRQEAVAPVP